MTDPTSQLMSAFARYDAKESNMPNSPRPGVKGRNVRVSDDLWEAAKIRAAERGETVTDVLRRALERYTR